MLHIFTAVLAGFGQIVGVRSSVEEPPYQIEEHIGAVEIRRYPPRIVAETEAEGSAEAARSEGFNRLAGYIFGGNKTKIAIAMTAPVGQAPVKIPMTAPVVQAKDRAGPSKIQFIMPADSKLDTMPVPNDPRVHLVEEQAAFYAVLRFSGDRSGAAVEKEQGELLSALKPSSWHPAGEPVAWFYDPPWTIPAFRRNEVAVEVSKS